MFTVYLAGRYSRRDEFKSYAEELMLHGIHVNSRWLHEKENPQCQLGDHSAEFYRETAHIDLEDIRNAEAILFFAEDPLVGTPRGGRHVEFGFALAIGLKPIVIGAPENIFHYLPWVETFPNLEEFVQQYAHPATV